MMYRNHQHPHGHTHTKPDTLYIICVLFTTFFLCTFLSAPSLCPPPSLFLCVFFLCPFSLCTFSFCTFSLSLPFLIREQTDTGQSNHHTVKKKRRRREETRERRGRLQPKNDAHTHTIKVVSIAKPPVS